MQCLSSSLSNYTSGCTKDGEPSPPWRIKIVMACHRTILRDESQTVGNRPLRGSSPTNSITQEHSLRISVVMQSSATAILDLMQKQSTPGNRSPSDYFLLPRTSRLLSFTPGQCILYSHHVYLHRPCMPCFWLSGAWLWFCWW